jgi:hypothetical protein
MKIQLAHLRVQGIDFAVFATDARSGSNSDRARLLQQLTIAARNTGLKVDKSALAYKRSGRVEYYGAKDLVQYLASHGVSHWNHTITL